MYRCTLYTIKYKAYVNIRSSFCYSALSCLCWSFCSFGRSVLNTSVYYTPFYMTHYFPSSVGLTSIVGRSKGQSNVEMKYGVPTV